MALRSNPGLTVFRWVSNETSPVQIGPHFGTVTNQGVLMHKVVPSHIICHSHLAAEIGVSDSVDAVVAKAFGTTLYHSASLPVLSQGSSAHPVQKQSINHIPLLIVQIHSTGFHKNQKV